MYIIMNANTKYIVGIDEVGRGPIAGPITFCAFIMKSETDILGIFDKRILKDSKKLTDAKRREIRTKLNKLKLGGEVDFVIHSTSAKIIDSIGLSKVIKQSIESCLNKLIRLNYDLDKSNTKIFLDGGLKIESEYKSKIKKKYNYELEHEAVIKGDENIPAIACASIMAKITRDNYMIYSANKIYDKDGKFYDWKNNVGYGTSKHYELLTVHGITELHRKSFLKNYLADR